MKKRGGRRKAQISVEFLIVIALGVMVITGLTFYLLKNQTNSIIISDADELVVMLADNVNNIYHTSPGSQKEVLLKFPKNIEKIGSDLNYVYVTLELFGDETNFTKKTDADDMMVEIDDYSNGMHRLIFKKEVNEVTIKQK